jgi:hypothetical protein
MDRALAFACTAGTQSRLLPSGTPRTTGRDVAASGFTKKQKPGAACSSTRRSRSRRHAVTTRARLPICPGGDKRGSEPCVARHLILVKFETMDHGEAPFHKHNYGVQLLFTCTTSLSGDGVVVVGAAAGVARPKVTRIARLADAANG